MALNLAELGKEGPLGSLAGSPLEPWQDLHDLSEKTQAKLHFSTQDPPQPAELRSSGLGPPPKGLD